MSDKQFRNALDMTRLEPGRLDRNEEGISVADPTSVWQGVPEGPDPRRLVLDLIAEQFMSRAHPGWRLLEIGGALCDFATLAGSRVGLNRITIMNTDETVVARAAEAGVNAHVGGVPKLPCSDNNFDVIVALWSLTHVEDLSAALADVHRVLRPGGRFLAIAPSDALLNEMTSELGGNLAGGLTVENGLDALGEHFTTIKRTPLDSRAVFDDWHAAHDHYARIDPSIAETLPRFEGQRAYVGGSTLFACASTNHPVPEAGGIDARRRQRPMSRPMRPPTGINHPGLTPPGLTPPGGRPQSMDLLGLGGAPEGAPEGS
jgi:SAM-dependent methyltransferase